MNATILVVDDEYRMRKLVGDFLRKAGFNVLEAADGVGMTKWQKLVLVEAPLSAPFIMAGIRTASVWTIGAATLANEFRHSAAV